MGQTTGIEWTDATWNPWHGCHKVSAGCKGCYMFTDKKRYGQNPNVVVRSKTTFNAPLKWEEPRRVFTCSWSDFLIEEADPWRDEAWDIMRRTPWHTYQVLTKRIERAAGHVPNPPLPNVWLGISCEDQATADERIPLLLQTPAAIRFVSYEPALGPVNFDQRPEDNDKPYWFSCFCPAFGQPGIDWIIAGGESGPGARSPHPNWFRNARDQCIGAGVPFFFKQWGEWAPTVETEPDNNRYHEWESGNFSARVGKKKAGALLDGQEWKQFPGTQPLNSVTVERSTADAEFD